jgi:hypothetical protein
MARGLFGDSNPAKRPEVREKIRLSKLGKKRPDISEKYKGEGNYAITVEVIRI